MPCDDSWPICSTAPPNMFVPSWLAPHILEYNASSLLGPLTGPTITGAPDPLGPSSDLSWLRLNHVYRVPRPVWAWTGPVL
jgi:hypothetical protein